MPLDAGGSSRIIAPRHVPHLTPLASPRYFVTYRRTDSSEPVERVYGNGLQQIQLVDQMAGPRADARPWMARATQPALRRHRIPR